MYVKHFPLVFPILTLPAVHHVLILLGSHYHYIACSLFNFIQLAV